MKKALQGATAVAAVMLAAPFAATAEEGWYGRVDAGYGFDGSLDIGGTQIGSPLTPPTAPPARFGDDLEFDGDWMASVGLGYGFQNGFRLEGEVAQRYNDIARSATVDDGADARAWTAMLNGLYDFNRSGRVNPYIGVGAGIARVDAGAARNAGLTGGAQFDDSDTGFAWQGLAGVGFKLTERLTADIGYRYLQTNNLEFNGARTRIPGNLTAPAPGARNFTGDYTHQAVTAGLRWQFAAPPPPVIAAPPPVPPPYVAPPPPPVPPPPPPVDNTPVVAPVVCNGVNFTVYFEWDRSNLTSEANAVIDRALEQARQCNASVVKVEGFTDTSGTPRYNVGLSQRRAAIVRDALVSRGIPGQIISTEAFGETRLATTTGDGVREPLNRRSEVVITFQQ
jgi:OmpA-OmpF porin, OOP family